MLSVIFALVGAVLSFIGFFLNSNIAVIVGIAVLVFYLYMGSVTGQLKSPVLDIVFAIVGIFVSLNLGKKWWYGIAIGLATCEIVSQFLGLIMFKVHHKVYGENKHE